MKINEVTELDEGVWDTLKQVGAGAVGAIQGLKTGSPIQGAKAGAAASAAASKQTDLIRKVTQKAVADWATVAQNLKLAGKPVDGTAATQWYTKYTGGMAPSTPATATNPAGMQQWLEKEIAGYMANKASGTQQPAANLDTAPIAPITPQQQMPKNPLQVKTPTGIIVAKQTDGKWVRQDDKTEVTDPKEIEKLESLAKTTSQTRTMAGKPPLQPVPPQQPATADQQPATAQQSAGTPQPAPTTAAGGDVFAGDTQQPATAQQQPAAEAPLPDVSGLTPEERAELRRQLQASMAK